MSEKKSIVALAKEPTIQESVTKVFELMGGVSSLVEKGSTVVLKPNAGHVAPPESAVCTNPDVVRAVIREVKKAEPKRIIIAEAAAIGCDTMECFEACGLTQVAKEEDVELIDGAGYDFDLEKVRHGKLSPVFFGSALTNFGVEPFLEEFLRMTPSPLPREADCGVIDTFSLTSIPRRFISRMFSVTRSNAEFPHIRQ